MPAVAVPSSVLNLNEQITEEGLQIKQLITNRRGEVVNFVYLEMLNSIV